MHPWFFLPRVWAQLSLIRQPLPLRSEFIKLCLVHAFRAIRVGGLFEIGFLLMNGPVQLSMTMRDSPSTPGWVGRLLPAERQEPGLRWEPGCREPVFSPKMSRFLPNDKSFAFQEQEKWLQLSGGMNGGASGVLRNLTWTHQVSDPVFSEYAALIHPTTLWACFLFCKMRITTSTVQAITGTKTALEKHLASAWGLRSSGRPPLARFDISDLELPRSECLLFDIRLQKQFGDLPSCLMNEDRF